MYYLWPQWVFVATRGVLQFRPWALLPSCGAWASRWGGVSLGRRLALQPLGSRACGLWQQWCAGLVASQHVGSSRTRDRTQVPCTARQILNRWTTRKNPPTFPDILECEVKWAFGRITMNKASGADGIPVELFQILKDDAVKVLHSICQQIWKSQQWPQDWKRSVFILIPKKGNAKECSNYHTIALISLASKVRLKILQGRLQQYVNCEFPDVQGGFRKGRRTRVQIANIRWIMEKAREFQKNIYFCFMDYAKAFDCVDHKKLENSEKDGNTRPPDLPSEKSVCRSRSNS